MSGTDTASPTVRRLLLGQHLRTYRQRSGLTADQVAAFMPTTSRTVLRWEAGQANIRIRDLRALLDLFAVSADDRAETEALARDARRPGWWSAYKGDIKPTFEKFLGMEEGATALFEYSAIVVPGLLQTERYMRKVMESAIPMLDDSTIDARIEIRRKRQAETAAREIPRHFIIDEACLMRAVGGPAVMNEQLEAIAVAAASRFVTVQVLPFQIGAHASILGGFALLEFEQMRPVACVELLAGDHYAEREDTDQYAEHFDKLREGALPEPHSLALVDQIRREFHHAQ